MVATHRIRTAVVKKRGVVGVFLDRDGTIIEEVEYVSRPEEIVVLPQVAAAIKLFNQNSIPVLVVTNQSGVARGFFPEDTVREINEFLAEMLREAGAVIDRFYFCPHHPDYGDYPYRQQCSCRKPKVGMLQQAADDYNIDLSRSYVIGDSFCDLEAAHNAHAKAVLVLTGYGTNTRGDMQCNETGIASHFVAPDLLAAARWVIQDMMIS